MWIRNNQEVWAVENLKIVAAYAKEKGIRLAIEPLNRFETDFINTVDQGLELFDRIGYDDYCVIESFTPECKEIAKSASVWRAFCESPESIPEQGIPFLSKVFS